MIMKRYFVMVLTTVPCLMLFVLQAAAAAPPADPILRIETGMHASKMTLSAGEQFVLELAYAEDNVIPVFDKLEIATSKGKGK